MKQRMNGIALRQVEALVASWRGADLAPVPPKGWIRAIREGLGMPASYLSRKMEVEQSTVSRYEVAETSGAISLKTLQRVADALGCDLMYALVPRKPMSQIIQDQAIAVAQRQINAIGHTMALEDQATSAVETEALIQEQAAALVDRSRRDLWR